MKGLTPQEKRETIGSFWCDDDDPALAVVDRSTLERYSTCPAQARLVETGAAIDASLPAESGEQVHQAIGKAVGEYVDSQGVMTGQDVRQALEAAIYSARPDVQPHAILGLVRCLWPLSKYITARHPANILRWDGGEGERSGQLAWDIPGLCRVTSEVDFLCATKAPAVLEESDWKSGWTKHGIDSIAGSFQFQVHAWLVLHNYPDVAALQVRVWQTRAGFANYPVQFHRDDLPKWTARIRSAVGLWYEHRLTPPQETPAWPLPEKCNVCPAAPACPAARSSLVVAANPAAAVDRLFALEAGLKQASDDLKHYAERHGPVKGSGPYWWGVKPPTHRKTYGVYTEAGQHEPQEESDASHEQ